MQHWVRFEHSGNIGFGVVEGEHIRIHQGNMFAGATATGAVLKQADVKLLAPTQPSKIVALWNNFKALGEKLGLQPPPELLYFLKSPNSWLNPGEVIRKPAQDGKIVFEGELGVVIGSTAKAVREADAMRHVFGYTCANDVTHADILNRDSSFAQWTRAKGFDTFCPFGPVVATGIDPQDLVVKTLLNGQLRQDYPISDMRYSVAQLVSRISDDMTLEAGDIILCGTSIGAGSMKPGSEIVIDIAGIGRLVNHFE